ncbi:MAG: hypothetical protein AABZ30_07425 [Myxococcota bacterium]
MQKPLFALFVSTWLATGSARADFPRIITYQGKLDGVAAEGDVDFEFALYEASAGGAPVWSEMQTASLWDGVFTVQLGTATSGGIPLDFADEAWLEVTAWDGAAPVVFPRQRLSAVAFAFRALAADEAEDAAALGGNVPTYYAPATHTHLPGDADTLDGLDATAFAFSDQSCGPDDKVTGIGSAGEVVCATDVDTDTDTTYDAGDGLTLAVTTFSVTRAVELEQALAGISAGVTGVSLSTLTGGPASDADALHTHTGLGESGVCYTNYGTAVCATGFTTVYTGDVIMPISSATAAGGGLYCYSGALSSSGPGWWLYLGRGNSIQVGTSSACAVCCR